MGRLVTNTAKPVVRVAVAQSNYKGIKSLAQTVHDNILANIATFATPNPTMANLATAIADLTTALSLLGTKFNKGGHTALTNVQDKSLIVYTMLTSLAMYVQSIVDGSDSAQFQATIISMSGFATKSKKSKGPNQQFTKRVRQSNSKKYPQTLRRISWAKPLGNTSFYKPKSYNIYGLHLPIDAPVFITSVTATNWLAPASFLQAGVSVLLKTVLIKPVTARGEGNGFKISVI